MLDYLNALFDVVSGFWDMFLQLPIYGDLTVGYFLICLALFTVISTYFVFNLKGS